MSKIKLDIITNYIGRSWTSVLTILLVPIYISFIGIDSYGLIGFYTALSSIMGILDLGISSTMNRELAKRSVVIDAYNSQRDLVKTLELIYWIIAIASASFVIFSAPFITNKWISSEVLNSHTVLVSVQLMGVAVGLRFPSSLYQGGLMGLNKQFLVNIILVIIGTLRGFGVFLVLKFISPTIEAFFFWQIIISIFESFIFYLAIWHNLPKSNVKSKFRFTIIKEVWRYAAAVSGNAFIGIVLTQLDKVILSKMLSLKMFAYYSIANTVTSSIWMIIIPFNSAIFPHLVKFYEKKDYLRLNFFFHHSTQILSFILLPISFVLIFFSKEILWIWTGDLIIANNSFLILSFLVFGTSLNGLVSMPANAAKAFGWPMLVTYTNLIQAVIIIPLIIVLVNWKQGIGASIAWIILNSTYLMFMVPYFFRRYFSEEKKRWYINDIILPSIISLVICAASKFINFELNNELNILVWILSTWLIASIVTGYSLVSIRLIFIKQINYFLNK